MSRGTRNRVLHDGHTAMKNRARAPGSFSLSGCNMAQSVPRDGHGV
jgi:hypothetical protein